MAKFSSELSGIFHSDIQEYEFPSGILSDDGWKEISNYVYKHIGSWPLVDGLGENYKHDVIYMRPAVGDNSVITGNTKTPGGPKYVGSFAKRISKFLHQECHRNAPKEAISQLGNIFSKHSTGGGIHYVDFSRRIDWKDGDFGDGGSCFWGCRSGARNLLEDQSDFHAVRLYKKNPYDEGFRGVGRAWILAHPNSNNAFVIFNAYGPMTTISIARLLSHRHGLSYYHSKSVYNNDTGEGYLFINSCAGTVIGSPQTLKELQEHDDRHEIDFGIDESEYDDSNRCDSCECMMHEENSHRTPAGEILCRDCFYDQYDYCERCSDTISNDNATEWDGSYYCQHCLIRLNVLRCESCDGLSDECQDVDGTIVCQDCYENTCFSCTKCDDRGLNENAVRIEDESYCEYCANLISTECADCGERFLTENMTEVESRVYCVDCIPEPAALTILDLGTVPCSHVSAEGQLNLF